MHTPCPEESIIVCLLYRPCEYGNIVPDLPISTIALMPTSTFRLWTSTIRWTSKRTTGLSKKLTGYLQAKFYPGRTSSIPSETSPEDSQATQRLYGNIVSIYAWRGRSGTNQRRDFFTKRPRIYENINRQICYPKWMDQVTFPPSMVFFFTGGFAGLCRLGPGLHLYICMLLPTYSPSEYFDTIY